MQIFFFFLLPRWCCVLSSVVSCGMADRVLMRARSVGLILVLVCFLSSLSLSPLISLRFSFPLLLFYSLFPSFYLLFSDPLGLSSNHGMVLAASA